MSSILVYPKAITDSISLAVTDEFGGGLGTAAKAVHARCALSNTSRGAKAHGTTMLLEFTRGSQRHRSESGSRGEGACLKGFGLTEILESGQSYRW
mmetsp:Transcript_8944/g.31737  ORF Transcript_8944/g.31737 Transcript_8944/m.31737 type:complete len:96 (-) Transcript_8944:1377-1664(-)